MEPGIEDRALDRKRGIKDRFAGAVIRSRIEEPISSLADPEQRQRDQAVGADPDVDGERPWLQLFRGRRRRVGDLESDDPALGHHRHGRARPVPGALTVPGTTGDGGMDEGGQVLQVIRSEPAQVGHRGQRRFLVRAAPERTGHLHTSFGHGDHGIHELGDRLVKPVRLLGGHGSRQTGLENGTDPRGRRSGPDGSGRAGHIPSRDRGQAAVDRVQHGDDVRAALPQRPGQPFLLPMAPRVLDG